MSEKPKTWLTNKNLESQNKRKLCLQIKKVQVQPKSQKLLLR